MNGRPGRFGRVKDLRRSYILAALADAPRDLLGARRSGRPRATGSRERVLKARLNDPAVERPFPRLAGIGDPPALSGPAVLVSFHLGAFTASGALLERLPHDVLGIRQWAPGPAERLTWLVLHGASELDRARMTRRAIAVLRAGGYVFLAVDGTAPRYVEMNVFGRPATVAAGAFELARLGNAPIVPVALRWRGPWVAAAVGQPIPPGEARHMAAALGRWYEGYVTAHPREVGWQLMTLSGRLGLDLAVFE